MTAKVQMQLAEKERDDVAEKFLEAGEQMRSLRNEAEETKKQLKDSEVWEEE